MCERLEDTIIIFFLCVCIDMLNPLLCQVGLTGAMRLHMVSESEHMPLYANNDIQYSTNTEYGTLQRKDMPNK